MVKQFDIVQSVDGELIAINKLRNPIATTKKDGGYPQLPSVEQDVEQLAKQVLGEDTMVGRGFWIEGYKAAQPKQFTADDLLTYMDLRMKIWRKSIKEQEFANHLNPFKASEEAVHQRAVEALIQSLQPVPKAVVLEMEDELNAYYRNGIGAVEKPKVDSNGFVIVKQWIYE